MRATTYASTGILALLLAGCSGSAGGGNSVNSGTGGGGGVAAGGAGSFAGSGGSSSGGSGASSSGGSAGSGMGGGGSGGSAGSSGSGGASGGSGGPAAGQLTAGDWDDNLNFEFFQDYLTATSVGPNERLASSDRVVIRVKTSSGEPISNAQVTVSQNGQALIQAPTSSDGRLLFFPEHDGKTGTSSLSVAVKPPGTSVGTTFAAPAGTEWELVVPGAMAAKPSGLDVAFVVDATGSMTDEIDYLTLEIDDIASGVKLHYPNVLVRYALIVYRDIGDEYVTRTFDFTSNLTNFKQNLSAQTADGGGDYEEAMVAALVEMNALSWSTNNSARAGFLIADAPPHPGAGTLMLEYADLARLAGIKIYPVAASGTDDRTELLMRQSAEWTLGRYLFITDDSGIGGPHAEPHIPCYEVTHLNNLMKRVLYSELEGKYIPADPGDIVRTSGNPVDGVCTTDEQETYFIY